jgi:quercetin dioxygenase-like cupin family protein
VLAFRIEEELFRLTRSEPLVQRGRSGRTLVKDGPLRVTLIALGPDGQIAPHRAAGPITVQVVYGSIRFEVDGESRTLFAGDMLALEAEVEHAVDSATGGAFLLTVVAPDNA